ncbi:pH-response regulator protein palI/RIM9 [Penicillium digitatum PHI26]|uniref:pH-response regulator protein palI/RIM9 n=2 Tax=Penicillium digitatum TaxID=36651 RepID=K9GCW6_PEND2|nr:pH-response regulator protein palI/RIM9 [Penicillium digitatum Pd1]EKV19022.1 pH-response regulator protein palI/RIM9 [Penicillium digitatum PHI26]EKV21086.1 pH-response regulator protein palI/RIM9 [Penicillium digitatum Pd1]
MLLKPATPLTILLLIAFVLLLLSCLSTPIVRGIPLATFKNVDYGVFGYCKDDLSSTDDFNLPSGTRKSLSAILIVHPVAAFLTLICLCLAIAAHFHAPSHSPRFLLALLILWLPTLLVTLLAFLVDILLFVPHLGWGGWIVLVATIILTSCGVVTCAMRRTLVSRKARKRRMAENAEMSGENYYNRQTAAAAADVALAPAPVDPKEAYVSNSFNSDSGPTFASFHTDARDSDDDRTPLNSRTPMSDIPAPPDNRGTPYFAPQNEFANLPPQGQGPYDIAPVSRNTSDPRVRPKYSDGSMGSRRGGAPPGFNGRGRGGYPPRGGRGGSYMGPSRAPSPGSRGGYTGPMAGRGGHGGMLPPRGPPADYGPGQGGANRGFDAYSQPVPPPMDDRNTYGPPGQMRQPSPGPIGMAVSPETVGQTIEMTPQHRPQHNVNASTQPMSSVPQTLSAEINLSVPESPTSMNSRLSSYIPSRSGWSTNDSRTSPRLPEQPMQPNNSGATYYEDVDPRFVHRPSPPPDSAIPHSLTPGVALF